MQRLEVSGVVRPIYESLGVKRLTNVLSRSTYYSVDPVNYEKSWSAFLNRISPSRLSPHRLNLKIANSVMFIITLKPGKS